jgi:RHH-type rel operon transcriptional repressor/antitoxin RelB
MLAIRLPRDIEDRLEKLARRTGRTKTFYAREAILEYLAEMEDRHLAASRLSRNLKGFPLKEVERHLDREGRLPPGDIREEVRRLGLSTPAESTRMIREDRDAR